MQTRQQNTESHHARESDTDTAKAPPPKNTAKHDNLKAAYKSRITNTEK